VIAREKQLKNWHRDWKKNLITQFNTNWDDLAFTMGILGDDWKGRDAETSSA